MASIVFRTMELNFLITLNNIKKIVFTGDILRPGPDFKSIQSSNIVWLFHMLKPYFHASLDNVTSSLILWNEETSDFDVPKFYELCNLDITLENWAKLSSLERVDKDAEEYCEECFRDSLIIGYETAPVFLNIFNKLDLSNIKDKEYIFKCGWKEGEHPCNGKHPIILSEELYSYLFGFIDSRYNIKIDNEFITNNINEFNLYIEKKYKENQCRIDRIITR